MPGFVVNTNSGVGGPLRAKSGLWVQLSPSRRERRGTVTGPAGVCSRYSVGPLSGTRASLLPAALVVCAVSIPTSHTRIQGTERFGNLPKASQHGRSHEDLSSGSLVPDF